MDRPPPKNRKRGGHGGPRSGGRPPQRRTPPPPHTGLEADFFGTLLREDARLVLKLADGREIRGTVCEFDRDQVTIERETGPIVIRKSEIRYLHEED